ncbi:MAG: hypothetical protein CVU43_20910 [Chloroflexi bacterium HGW-Chloroflexi-5]|jgi:triacylglycerol lipase|nr:MAG: hypothetical protein CVU54_05610 [Deltaproteobacteria bacterium HGW-Deltaproteobacteria-12]PKN96401.1 MAG: hypothetical protein CVU43_20910 [Chloroflexi bacterium HGW-Chloroflexi-5]
MGNRYPVVFIHGNGDSADGWKMQLQRFKEQGYSENELFAITMKPPQNETHQHYAHQVKRFIDDVLAKTGAKKVNIVAHSLGCTVSRHYIKFMDGHKTVEHAVLISGGNHGLPAADLTLTQAQIFKQSPEINTLGAQFLQDLNTGNPGGLETYGETKYMTISGPDDEFFLFFENSPQLKGADNRVIKGHGHFGLRDSAEAFICSLAFFEGKADSCSLGKAPPDPVPQIPVGSWIVIGGPKKGDAITFNANGTYEGKEGNQPIKGTYTIHPGTPASAITLHQTEGPDGPGKRQGIFRININNTFLKLNCPKVNSSDPPIHITYAPTYDRAVQLSAIPEYLTGVWKAQDLGFCAAAGWTEGQLEITPDGTFTIKGKNVLSPTGFFEISGNVSVSFEPVRHQMTFDLTKTCGNIPFFLAGDILPAIFTREGNKLKAQWGSFLFGIPRPSCLDIPITFIKT